MVILFSVNKSGANEKWGPNEFVFGGNSNPIVSSTLCRCAVSKLGARLFLIPFLLLAPILAVAATPRHAYSQAESSLSQPPSVASLSTLSQMATRLLKDEATASEPQQSELALTALCDFYVLMRSDPRYSESEMLRGDAAKVRRRLIKSAHHLEHCLRRSKIPRPETLSAAVDAMIRESELDFQAGKRTRLSDYDIQDPTDSSTDEEATEDGRGGGAAADNGWQLVELIERVVAPEFWDTRGGAGTIHYYAMRRVLVVRATSDVHEQIRDLLIALGW
ncbi:hypothetical protein SH528x_001421 [Novipirellula sp. SH528]|uniref:hypothetical protein n=1 Tax=Novipirellula sp. SH528 TaxID=3454466 RepID=UPI003F9FEB3A